MHPSLAAVRTATLMAHGVLDSPTSQATYNSGTFGGSASHSVSVMWRPMSSTDPGGETSGSTPGTAGTGTGNSGGMMAMNGRGSATAGHGNGSVPGGMNGKSARSKLFGKHVVNDSMARQDSFEMMGGLSAAGAPKGPCLSLAEVLRGMGASPGQWLTQVIMEYCDAGSLHRAISSKVFSPSSRHGASLRMRALLRTALEVARGMAHLHSLDIIHGE